MSKNNYTAYVKLNSGVEQRISIVNLTGFFNVCINLAAQYGSTFREASIYPVSERARAIFKKQLIYLDSSGKYYYYDKGKKYTY